MTENCSKQDVFFDGNFTPAFFDIADLGNLTDEALKICGDNKQCLYDIAQTRDLSIGKSTRSFEDESKKLDEELGK